MFVPRLRPLRLALHRRLSTAPPPRSPKLKRYAALFANKPVSYFTAFLILHEITAILPVGGIFWYLHATQWTPPGLPQDLVEKKIAYATRWTHDWGLGEWFSGEKGARLLLE